MKRLVSTPLEQMVLMGALQSKSPKIRALVLTETTEEDYGTAPGMEVRKRITSLLRLGKGLGGAAEFAEDPALSSVASEFIKGTVDKRAKAESFTEEQVKVLLYKLKLHRNARVFHKSLEDINNISIGNVDEEKFEKMAEVMEKTLVQVRQGFEKQPLSHMGKRQSDAEAKKLLEELVTFVPGMFVSTGLPGLDRLIYGWERGNLVTVSATRGGGKSTMAMNMGINQYLLANNNVCYVSMEMTEKELWKRVLSNLSKVPHDTVRYPKIMKPNQRKQVGSAWKYFHRHGHDKNCTFTIWDIKDSYFTPMKLESYLAPFMYDIIIVDYVTLFHSAGADTWKMQLEYSKYLKAMAKRLNCVVVLLTQLSDEERVKYGRSIEENTDYWIWWRWREDEEQETGDVELKLAKARHTSPRKFPAKFMLDVMKIETQGLLPYGNASSGDQGKGGPGGRSDIFSNAGDY